MLVLSLQHSTRYSGSSFRVVGSLDCCKHQRFKLPENTARQRCHPSCFNILPCSAIPDSPLTYAIAHADNSPGSCLLRCMLQTSILFNCRERTIFYASHFANGFRWLLSVIRVEQVRSPVAWTGKFCCHYTAGHPVCMAASPFCFCEPGEICVAYMFKGVNSAQAEKTEKATWAAAKMTTIAVASGRGIAR